MLSIRSISKILIESIAATLVFAVVALMGHMILEPLVSKAQSASSQFTTKQTIGAEISFLTNASNVVLSPAIGGITGGAATGSTQVVVYTNNSTGYTMTIQASGTVAAMKADSSSSTISNYTPAGNFPDFNWVNNSTGQAAEFGFTVSASTTGDLAQKFLDNGSTCNTGSSDTSGANTCWTYASSTATSTIATTGATLTSGSTSTIFLHTNVPANPSPSLTNGTYTATTTLTATTNP